MELIKYLLVSWLHQKGNLVCESMSKVDNATIFHEDDEVTVIYDTGEVDIFSLEGETLTLKNTQQ